MQTPQMVSDASVWRGCDVVNDTSWRNTLTPRHIEEIEAAAIACKARGLEWSDIKREDFPLPTLSAQINKWAHEINHGRGFMIVKGLPVARLTNEQVRCMFWGIGLHMGVPLSQNSYGEMLGDVYDEGAKMGAGRVRGYRTNQQLRFHTDRADIVGLLCLQQSLSGGMSSLVSSTAIYNEIARVHPEHLPVLMHGLMHATMEEGGKMVTYRMPVYDVRDGVVSCRILRNTIENTRKMALAEFTDIENAALEYMDSLTNHPDMRLDMMLERGDMQFVNNYTTLHARTEFEDYPEPERKRHMVRLWLKANGARRRVTPETFSDYHGLEKTLVRKPGTREEITPHG